MHTILSPKHIFTYNAYFFGTDHSCLFRWNVFVICATIVLKLAVTAFSDLYFRTLWSNWLYFLGHLNKNSVFWPKKSAVAASFNAVTGTNDRNVSAKHWTRKKKLIQLDDAPFRADAASNSSSISFAKKSNACPRPRSKACRAWPRLRWKTWVTCSRASRVSAKSGRKTFTKNCKSLLRNRVW